MSGRVGVAAARGGVVGFEVLKPVPLRLSAKKFGRQLDVLAMDEFWTDHPAVAGSKGCYVFAMSKKPFYVGKATKSFKQEVFNSRNINTYNKVVAEVPGKPALYLIALTKRKGKTPSTVIGEVEKLLIGMAHEANPDIGNIHHKNKPLKFAIQGVHNSGKGKRSAAAKALRSVLKLSNGVDAQK